MENTRENKAKFFAQYWGTKTLYVGGVGLCFVGSGGWNLRHPDFHLELTSLKDITDEDAQRFGEIYCEATENCCADLTFSEANDVLSRLSVLPFSCADYLRSKGYLLPFNGLSTEELITRGWAKTK